MYVNERQLKKVPVSRQPACTTGRTPETLPSAISIDGMQSPASPGTQAQHTTLVILYELVP